MAPEMLGRRVSACAQRKGGNEQDVHLGILLRVHDGGDGDAEVGGRAPEV